MRAIITADEQPPEVIEPELHYATDRRCYDGVFCSDLQKEIDSRNRLMKEIQILFPEFRCVYFPYEGKYLAFMKYKEITGKFHEDKGQCLLESWRKLIR